MSRGSERGSVRKRTENGKWQARYVDPAGKRFSATFRTEREARQWLRDRLYEMDQGVHGRNRAAEMITFAEWYEQWLGLITVRPSTEQIYRSLAERFLLPEFGTVRLGDITSLHVQRWWAGPWQRADGRPYASSYRAKTYRLLKLILGDATDHGVLKENPCKVKDVKDVWTERVPPTEAQVALIADAAPERFRALVLVSAYCGLRWGEVAGLSRANVNLETRTLHVRGQALEMANGSVTYSEPKTKAGIREVQMPRFVANELADHMARFTRAGDDAVVFTFTTSDGYMRRSNFRPRVWVPTLKRAGLTGIRFHDLRHTAGTLAAQEGGSVRGLMVRLGHSTPRASLIYQHATKEEDNKIADALDRRYADRKRASHLRAV